MSEKKPLKCFPSAGDSIKDATLCVISSQTKSESYRLAFDDPDFVSDRARVVKEMMVERMIKLSSEEFQYLLRPAFQEDEMKLIIMGAVLGLAAGMGQLFLVFGGIGG